MGNLSDVFRYAWNNDLKGLNQSIEDIGREHHAEYIADMLIEDDICSNYELMLKMNNTMSALYHAVKENCRVKQQGLIMLKLQSPNSLQLVTSPQFLTENQLNELVYNRALEYYFGVDTDIIPDYEAFLDQAVLHRRASSYMQINVESILLKVEEDTDLVDIDTKNVLLLMQNYKCFDKGDSRLKELADLLAESIKNVVLQEDGFKQDFYDSAGKIADSMRQFFYGG